MAHEYICQKLKPSNEYGSKVKEILISLSNQTIGIQIVLKNKDLLIWFAFCMFETGAESFKAAQVRNPAPRRDGQMTLSD